MDSILKHLKTALKYGFLVIAFVEALRTLIEKFEALNTAAIAPQETVKEQAPQVNE
jgi:hypothetical protein